MYRADRNNYIKFMKDKYAQINMPILNMTSDYWTHVHGISNGVIVTDKVTVLITNDEKGILFEKKDQYEIDIQIMYSKTVKILQNFGQMTTITHFMVHGISDKKVIFTCDYIIYTDDSNPDICYNTSRSFMPLFTAEEQHTVQEFILNWDLI